MINGHYLFLMVKLFKNNNFSRSRQARLASTKFCKGVITLSFQIISCSNFSRYIAVTSIYIMSRYIVNLEKPEQLAAVVVVDDLIKA